MRRSLRARFSHSRGSWGASTIDLSSLAQRGRDDQTMRVAILLDLFGRNQHHIYCLANAVQVNVDVARKLRIIKGPAFDHEQVHIAVPTHLTASSRAKQENALRLRNQDDTRNNFAQQI